MKLAENESRRVGMKFKALVELSLDAEGLIPVIECRVDKNFLFRYISIRGVILFVNGSFFQYSVFSSDRIIDECMLYRR
jgi:hypothetical protein